MRGEQRNQFSDLKTSIDNSGIPTTVRNQLNNVRDDDESTVFPLMDSLVDETFKQFIILMHEGAKSLDRSRDPFYAPLKFELATENSGAQGMLNVNDFCKKLAGTELLQADINNSVSLTRRGHSFADWLVTHGKKAMYFSSEMGQWGTPPDRWAEAFRPFTPNPQANGAEETKQSASGAEASRAR
jgi:hypothetical protein